MPNRASALLGRNGAGSPPLSKMLSGSNPPPLQQAGVSAGVSIGYFASISSRLCASMDSLDHLVPGPDKTERELGNGPAASGFHGDKVLDKSGPLLPAVKRVWCWPSSPGKPNLLLLDEPTNHYGSGDAHA